MHKDCYFSYTPTRLSPKPASIMQARKPHLVSGWVATSDPACPLSSAQPGCCSLLESASFLPCVPAFQQLQWHMMCMDHLVGFLLCSVGYRPLLQLAFAWGNQKLEAFNLSAFSMTGLEQEGSPGCCCEVHAFLLFLCLSAAFCQVND